MTSEDHIALIKDAVRPGGNWADLGSGSGAFTVALCRLLGSGGHISSVERDARALHAQERELRARFPLLRLDFIPADFNNVLPLSGLDGVVMANSLHFQRDPCAVITRVSSCLAPGGRLVVVEYDIETPNQWVPFPVAFARLGELAACAGLTAPLLLGTRPSRYHRRVYAAVCHVQ
jgi:SAM-dependent methyltransferase